MKKGFTRHAAMGAAAVLAFSAFLFTAFTAAPATPSQASDAPKTARGRVLYTEQGCTTCHAINGIEGRGRTPLDGVGTRLKADQIHARMTGTGFDANAPSATILRRKQQYQQMAAEDADALVHFLSGLRAGD